MSKHFYSRCPLRPLAFAALLSFWCASPKSASTQSTQPENKPADRLYGTVINSATHEPIGRALVYSADKRLAAMTDSEGHFEITFAESETDDNRNNESGPANRISYQGSNRRYTLLARKPGFLDDRITQGLPTHTFVLSTATTGEEFTLLLTPEALVVGRVALLTAEASDTIQLELYRRQVQEGRAHWVPAGSASTKSNGEFRFAELPAGSYKLFTREVLDRDPLIFDPRGQLYGYPPVYFPNATDFAAAQTIQLAAGQIFQADISLVRHAYYPVKVPVTNAPLGTGIGVVVSVQGHRGPGFALGYNHQDQRIEGMLPNGNYTLEASGFGPNAASGSLNISVKGAAVEGPHMTLMPNSSISVNVKEEFTSTEDTSSPHMFINGLPVNPRVPRSYLNLRLEPADDFGQERGSWLRPPSTPEDDSLAIDGVQPGRYWVRADSSRGFAAAIASGITDLQHQPLVVGWGGSSSPIEITMRDATAEIDGTIEGVGTPGTEGTTASSNATASVSTGTSSAHVYCVPLPDSTGEFKDVWVPENGKFGPQPLPPGTYRVLAFDHPQPELEYHSPDAMRAYDAKGQLVRVVAGQKEHLRLQLISTSE